MSARIACDEQREPNVADFSVIPTPEPQPVDEEINLKLQHLAEDAILRGHPYQDEKCGNCLYYLDTDAEIAYCWHPKLRILVGTEWWCQWWEEIPADA